MIGVEGKIVDCLLQVLHQKFLDKANQDIVVFRQNSMPALVHVIARCVKYAYMSGGRQVCALTIGAGGGSHLTCIHISKKIR